MRRRDHHHVALGYLAKGAMVISDVYEVGHAEDADGRVIAVVTEADEVGVRRCLWYVVPNGRYLSTVPQALCGEGSNGGRDRD